MSILVVGGGAAGMMAAVSAAAGGASVCLVEKNEKLGKKLFITGKGRCNLTNAAEDEAFFSKVFRNPRFFRSAFSQFDNQRVISFFEEAGLPLKTERGGRVFPCSDKSSDVIKTLEALLKKRGVKILLNTQVISLVMQKQRIRGVLVRQAQGVHFLPAEQVILASGGLSYPSTGSTGDGYRLAGMAGHETTELLPSLVPLNASFSPSVAEAGIKPADLMGLSLKNVSLRLMQEEKKLWEEQGEMLFTHFGISGPLVLSVSAIIGDCILQKKAFQLLLDLKPALSRQQLETRILRDQAEAGKKTLGGFLREYLPRALIPAVLKQAEVEEDEKAARLSRSGREALIDALKGLAFSEISLRDYPEAVVTRGGLRTAQIQPKTLESKLAEGLYLAGEMLDLDAATGGYNLQIAWSSGYAAGKAAGEASRGKETSMNSKKKSSANRHIAIDGPGSSGKSTIARQIAGETGLIYVDTGAMFRGMAVYFLRKGLDPSDEAGICAAAQEADVSIDYEKGEQQVYLNGENVTGLLREERTGQMASASSVYGPVREKMKELQQKLAAEKNVVMDGRDIGTVILPDAYLKIFMTASLDVRAARRFKELSEKGQNPDFETVRKELEERDQRDMNREIAPLKQAEDAVLIDTSEMTVEEVKEAVLKLYGWEE